MTASRLAHIRLLLTLFLVFGSGRCLFSQITPGGVENAASAAPNGVVPGSLASVYGRFPLNAPTQAFSTPWPSMLSGLSVQFGGSPAALYYASGGQVNLQVPWELAGQTQTFVTSTFDGQTTATQTLTLALFAPGIFSMNGQGTGQGAILDASFNRLVDTSNPATAGTTFIQIYCTGLGPVTNQPPSGAAAPLGPLAETMMATTVTIGGASALVLYSGLAPTEVGVYQVNAQVPAGAPTGNAVPVVVSVGGVKSNTVTIAINPVDFAGAWAGSWVSSTNIGQTGTLSATFTQAGTVVGGSMSLTGSPCYLAGNVSGAANGNQFGVNLTNFGITLASLSGNESADSTSVTGTYLVANSLCHFDQGTFSLSRP